MQIALGFDQEAAAALLARQALFRYSLSSAMCTMLVQATMWPLSRMCCTQAVHVVHVKWLQGTCVFVGLLHSYV